MWSARTRPLGGCLYIKRTTPDVVARGVIVEARADRIREKVRYQKDSNEYGRDSKCI